MLRLFSSLKTTLGLVLALVALSVWGSVAIQNRPEDYASIEAGILWHWLKANGIGNPAASWWIAGMVCIAALLSINTLVCVAVRLQRAFHRRSLPLRSLSAHLAHLGFLLVLAAHLLGSVAGFRSDGHAAYPGGRILVAERPGWEIQVDRVHAAFAPQGYPTALEAGLSVRRAGQVLATGTARVNAPIAAQGVTVYLKNAEPGIRGWGVQIAPDGLFVAEIGTPVSLPSGTLLLANWASGPSGPALHVAWTPTGLPGVQGWVSPAPGRALSLPQGPVLTWGEMVVDTLGTFDVRYDPGARLALAGGALLSSSVLLLLWRRPASAGTAPSPPAPTFSRDSVHPDEA